MVSRSLVTVTPVYTSSITAQANGVIGRLFREFAVTLAVAIILSAVVSLTLTPMMCSRILRQTPENRQGRVFNNIIAFYGRTLKFVLSCQTITLLVAVATLALTIVLYIGATDRVSRWWLGSIAVACARTGHAETCQVRDCDSALECDRSRRGE